MLPYLKRKIARSLKIIREGFKRSKNPYLSCSWGKDSILTLFLTHFIKPNIHVVFMNSGYDLPELYKTRDLLLKKLKIKHYTELSSPIDYISLITKYGMRNINRSDKQQKKILELIKKNNIDDWAIENGFDGFVWGMRAQESVGRKIYLSKFGPIHRAKNGLVRITPLIWWTTDEVWDAIHELELPYPKFYDYTDLLDRNDIRSSGWLTTDGATRGRIVWLKVHYPEQFNELAKRFPEVRSYV